ncbi:hypothetical protein J6590_045031 [Homalodisca vitripennis]|nr:hypothetical protein J6590_045031 [Homalodisca vitripennis]
MTTVTRPRSRDINAKVNDPSPPFTPSLTEVNHPSPPSTPSLMEVNDPSTPSPTEVNDLQGHPMTLTLDIKVTRCSCPWTSRSLNVLDLES